MDLIVSIDRIDSSDALRGTIAVQFGFFSNSDLFSQLSHWWWAIEDSTPLYEELVIGIDL